MTTLIIQSLSSAAHSVGEFVKYHKLTRWFSNFGELPVNGRGRRIL